MKKFISLIIITLFLILFSFALPSGIQAAEFHFKSYTLTQEETVKDDIYAFGDSVKIDGVIDGDLIVIASNVQLNGTVTGDAYLFGTTVNINGNVIGTTTIFANNTSVQGVLSENVSIVSTYITFNAQTSKDVFALSAENTFQGSIGDDLRAYSIKSNIDSTVSGDLLLLGNDYTVSEEKISRNIYYNSTLNTIARDQGVDVENGVKIKMPVVIDKSIENNWSFISLKALVGFVSFALIGLLLITLTPVKSAEISSKITDSPDEFLKSLIMGFAIFLLLPFPIFLLMISIVGFPAAILIGGILFFAMYFGRVWVELSFGKELLELFGVKGYRPYKSFLVGRIISVSINFIPVVRGFYNTILSLVALGAIFRVKKEYYQIAKEQAEKYKSKKKK